VESNPNQQQRADQAEHPSVEFCGFEKAGERRQMAWPDMLSRRRRLGHWILLPGAIPAAGHAELIARRGHRQTAAALGFL